MTEPQLKPLTERVLRDLLAAHLDLIEPGLSLVGTEYRLENDLGASGSIDILARDSTGNLVVIELKRLDQTARQALHELEKYVGLLAADRGIRVDRLRSILISTTWHELLVPFARFVSHADFHVSGRRLILGEDGSPVRSELVELPELDPGLEVCPIHMVLLFAARDAREATVDAVAGALRDMCVEDYITVDLDYVGANPHVIFPFGHYFAFAEFPEALRDFVRTKFPDECEEEPEDSPWWHEQLVQEAVTIAAHADDVEISGPGRFGALDDFEMQAVVGHGRYADPLVWPRDELLRTLAAGGETFSMPYQRQVAVANKPAWTRMRDDLDRCLQGAGAWPQIVAALLDEIEQRPRAVLMIHAYVPTDILGGLNHLVRNGTADYLPQLILQWQDDSAGAWIGGKLEWDGVTFVTSVDQTLGAVFDDDFMMYATARVTGGLWHFETELCHLHGLRYDIAEAASWQTMESLDRVALDADGRLLRSPMAPDEPSTQDFVAAHVDYLDELAAVFRRYTATP